MAEPKEQSMSNNENQDIFQSEHEQKEIFVDYKPDKRKKSLIIILCACILVLVFVGSLVAGIFIGANNGINGDMPLLTEAYELIKKYYYKDISWKQFQEMATGNFAGSLDQFTGLAIQQVSNSSKGVGISVSSNTYNEHRISSIYQDSPAATASTKITLEFDVDKKDWTNVVEIATQQKLQLGDRLYSIGIADADGNYNYFRVENAANNLIRTLIATQTPTDIVKLRVFKNENTSTLYEYTITKAEYSTKKAYYIPEQVIGGQVAMIQFLAFDSTACEDFDEAINDFKNDPNHPNKLILDLRGNGGGDSEILGYVASYLVKHTQNSPLKLARYEFNSGDGKQKETFFSTRTTIPTSNDNLYVNRYLGNSIDGFDCVILCNDSTASSSEVLIGAMQYYNGTQIVGTKTYGKGVGQRVEYIGNKQYKLYITNGYYYIPTVGANGDTLWEVNIHGKGFLPSSENLISAVADLYPTDISNDKFVARAKEILVG